MEDRLKKACKGLSYTRGGLNLTDLIKIADQKSISNLNDSFT
jgi:hypothetical protein